MSATITLGATASYDAVVGRKRLEQRLDDFRDEIHACNVALAGDFEVYPVQGRDDVVVVGFTVIGTPDDVAAFDGAAEGEED